MKALVAIGGGAGLVVGAFTFGNFTAQFIVLGIWAALTLCLLTIYIFQPR